MYEFLIFYIGAIFGSYINLVKVRTIRQESTIFPRSHCDYCGKQLKAIELLPIFSYLIQKGRCRSCGSKIGRNSLITEIICGELALLSLGFEMNLGSIIIFFSFLLALLIALIDCETMDIYSKHLLILAGLGLVYRFIYLGFTRVFISNYLIFSLIYGMIFKLSRENIGNGDYYFYLSLGLFLHDSDFVLFILLSIWLGGFVGIIILIKTRKLGNKMPFAIFIFLSYIILYLLNRSLFL